MEVVRIKGFRDRRKDAAAQSIKQQEAKPTKSIKQEPKLAQPINQEKQKRTKKIKVKAKK